jgi:4-hydroxy-3-polyprenylbenzoate decarboxylase
MAKVSRIGGIIAPPMPAFYIKPKTVEELVDHHVGRILDLFDIESELVQRWQGPRK